MVYRAYINPIEKRELSFCIRHYSHHIMWLCLAFLLIIGAAIADHNHAWETGNEYHFLIKSRTLTALDKLAEQFSGILMKGSLIVQVKSLDTLQALVSKTQYASVNKILPDIWDEITDLDFHELSLSGKPFEIKLKQGIIQDMLVDQDVPTWEVNLLKSIVSQLQIDTEGKNVITSRSSKIPNDNQPSGTFKVMEDSIGGKCEVLYSITPVDGNNLSVPLPHLHKDGLHLAITKTKNYTRCEQRIAYHSGIVGKMNWKSGSNDELLSRSSTTRIIISGNLKRFTIQSSMMTNQILINSKIDDTYSGAVYSGMNLTLDRMNQISNPIPASNNLVSTGNLVYTYNNPFSSQRKPRRPNVNRSSLAARSSENRNSNSSSEENYSDDDLKSEERDYLQPKPKLDDAPENPLLPYFIGYKGMSIVKSEENYALLTARLISEISREIGHFSPQPVSDPYIETLERFTILIRLIRTMNVEQIAEVKNKLSELCQDNCNNFSSKKDEKLYNQTVWDVFYHAISNAGTGPALVTIKNLIKNGKLKGIQAAQIVSKIPKSALAPTAEYITAFFELITDEQVTKQRFLNTTAPLSFAELARYTQSNKLSVYYPVYSFGRIVSKHDNALFETYIPYMAAQLRKAIEEADSRRIQTYIMALGNFGHPKILSVFEPYLEGTIPVSKFQRLMMVISLSKLSESFPRVVRSVAYKIYLNQKEAYELRCAAVHIIMKTNPSLIMLQRMAEFTNQDQDRHVNSVVKTSLESLANLKQLEWKDLADKARIASKLLNPNINDENYSEGIFKETKISSLNIAQAVILQTIGSDDTDIPKGAYFDIFRSYGGLNLPLSRILYAVSSIEYLQQMWLNIWFSDRSWNPKNKTEKNWIIEQIVEKLDIKPENVDQFEGNIFVDSVLGLEFYPFDNHTFEEFVNMVNSWYESIMQTKSDVIEYKNNDTIINYLYHYDMTLGFPTETGLPFIYTLALSKFMSREGSYKITKSQTENFIELTIAGHIISGQKIQSRIGFVTPFEHRHYIAGIDINSQIFIPAGFSIKSTTNNKFELKIYSHENYRYPRHIAIHHSVVPYTSRHDILDFQPVVYYNDTRLVHTKEPYGREFSLSGLIFSARSDLFDGEMKKTGIEAFAELYAIFYSNLGAHYRKFDIILYPTEAQINFTYHHVEMLTNKNSEATIPIIIDKQPDSEARKLQFLQEVIKDNRSVNSASDVFDISILADNNYNVFTFAWANIHDKFQALSYGNVQSPDGEIFWETCSVQSIVGSSQYSYLNVEKAIEKIPNYEFKAEMRFGNCADGETIKFKGNLTRSDDVMKMAMKSEIVEKCQQQIKQGNIWLPACQKANKLIQQRDLLKISMETDSDYFYALANRMILMIKMMILDTNMKILSSQRSSDDNYMDMEIKMPLNDNDANISLSTSQMDVTFSLSNFFEDPNVIFPNFTLNKLFEEDSEGDMCALDKTQIVTFDNKIYPLNLGKCWHVMMAPYPKRDFYNPEILSFPVDVRVIVMAREMDDGSKQVWMILGHQEIRLQKSGDHLEATVDGVVANFSSHDSYREEAFEIYQLDEMIAIRSLKYDIYIVYDGERILLYLSDKYLNSIRGLCGNYDMQSNNDFITPKNCILKKSEEFTATYALIHENCQGPALQNKQKAEQSMCISKSYIPDDVISEREMGRFPRNTVRTCKKSKVIME